MFANASVPFGFVRGLGRTTKRVRRDRALRPMVGALEGRVLLSGVVTNTNDSGVGSLRAAMIQGGTITFSVGGTLALQSPLPALTNGTFVEDTPETFMVNASAIGNQPVITGGANALSEWQGVSIEHANYAIDALPGSILDVTNTSILSSNAGGGALINVAPGGYLAFQNATLTGDSGAEFLNCSGSASLTMLNMDGTDSFTNGAVVASLPANSELTMNYDNFAAQGVVAQGTNYSSVSFSDDTWANAPECASLSGAGTDTFVSCTFADVAGVASVNGGTLAMFNNSVSGGSTGGVSVQGASAILNKNTWSTDAGTIFSASDCSNITDNGDTFTANGGATSIALTNVTSAAFGGVTFDGNSGGSVGIDGNLTAGEQITVNNCTFSGTTTSLSRVAFLVQGSGLVNVTGSQFEIAGVSQFFGGTSAVFSGNAFTNSPVSINATGAFQFSEDTYSDTIEGSNVYGVDVITAGSVMMIGETVIGNTNASLPAFEIDRTPSVDVEKSTFTNVDGRAIGITQVAAGETATINGSSFTNGGPAQVYLQSVVGSTATVSDSSFIKDGLDTVAIISPSGASSGGIYNLTDDTFDQGVADYLNVSFGGNSAQTQSLNVTGCVFENENYNPVTQQIVLPTGASPAIIVALTGNAVFNMTDSTVVNCYNEFTGYAPWTGLTMVLSGGVSLTDDTISGNGGGGVSVTLAVGQSLSISDTTINATFYGTLVTDTSGTYKFS